MNRDASDFLTVIALALFILSVILWAHVLGAVN